MKWFGPYSWGAPICEGTRVEVPAGARCTGCGEVIYPHDRGFLIPEIGRGDIPHSEEPWHYGCLMRATGGPDWQEMVGEKQPEPLPEHLQ